MAAQILKAQDIPLAIAENVAEESQITAELTNLLQRTEHISTALAKLAALSPLLGRLQADALQLRENVGHTATTANRVGSRVKALDEEMRRAREAAERVAQVIELKVGRCTVRNSILTFCRIHCVACIVPLMQKNGSQPPSSVRVQWIFLRISRMGVLRRLQSCV